MANNRRPQTDYYEYKRRYEELRRARGGQPPVAPQPEPTPEPEPERKPRSRAILGSLKQAVTGLTGRGEAPEAELEQDVPAEIPEATDVSDFPDEEQTPANAPETDDLPLDEEEDERQIDNPFSDAADKIKKLGGKLAGLAGKIRRKKDQVEDEEPDAPQDQDEDEAPDAPIETAAPTVPVISDVPIAPAAPVISAAPAASDVPVIPTAPTVSGVPVISDAPTAPAAMPLEAEEDTPEPKPIVDIPAAADVAQDAQAAPRRAERKAKPQSAVKPQEEPEKKSAPRKSRVSFLFGSPIRAAANQADDDDEDIAPSGGRRWFGRREPEPEEETLEEQLPVGESQSDEQAAQDFPDEPITEQLAADMDEEETAAPSRRTRRASRAARRKDETKAPDEAEAPDEEVPDEPTQAFKPLRRAEREDDQPTRRFQPVRRATSEEDEAEDEEEEERRPARGHAARKRAVRVYQDEDLDDEDDEDDDLPVRGYARRKRGGMRVYQDEDLEDGEDDDYSQEYEDDSYEDDDYDDPYDEDRIGFGKRLLRFVRALLIIVLILGLAVLALRQLEANGRLSLDVLRNSIGVLVPLDKVFPTPVPEGLDAPQATDAPATPMPTLAAQASAQPTQTPVETPEPSRAPVGVAVDITPRASAEFVDEKLPEAVG